MRICRIVGTMSGQAVNGILRCQGDVRRTLVWTVYIINGRMGSPTFWGSSTLIANRD